MGSVGSQNRKVNMPNPLNAPWNQIIPLIPVVDHAVTVEAATWEPWLRKAGYQEQFKTIFGGDEGIRISRERLLNHPYPTNEQKCLEILMWGYPSGMRGRRHHAFLANLRVIAARASVALAWPAYFATLNGVKGLGISTISKLAYFYGYRFSGFQSLILDDRLIGLLTGGRWANLTMPTLSRYNAHKKYPEYLAMMTGVAALVPCQPEQVEYFLFSLGDSF